ncbi:NAD-dependent epimerase/dehydratase [Cynara cardunculus var. scolymus]|uniref:NAD-dependent epimerase/dehydratase n=1 Tax=Cynara cardunculus var. scolymus TaxID=59895 RepID=A0A118JT63_CYNCS|nr:NAD-dependent epimerase/dehydratase [Cynara cardunculus var. scolymus]
MNLEMESKSRCKVCVTGGAGYIGSALVHSLLQNGYTVHATLRNLDAEERLHLFEADIYRPQEFEEAIQGCVYVFHLATPIYDTSGYKYNDKIKATISAVKKIVDVCIQSRTVKRLIYTASVVAASPLKDDGSGYKTTMDESCWTPFHINVPYSNDFVKEYTEAKTRAEQEILKIGEDEANELEVVTLSCGLVGGRETPMVNGRFLCSSSYITSAEMAKYYQENYPQFHLKQEYFEGPKRDIKWGSRKLEDEGFSYKHDAKTILDDCIEYARRSGNI